MAVIESMQHGGLCTVLIALVILSIRPEEIKVYNHIFARFGSGKRRNEKACLINNPVDSQPKLKHCESRQSGDSSKVTKDTSSPYLQISISTKNEAELDCFPLFRCSADQPVERPNRQKAALKDVRSNPSTPVGSFFTSLG